MYLIFGRKQYLGDVFDIDKVFYKSGSSIPTITVLEESTSPIFIQCHILPCIQYLVYLALF